jgi:hypothetical protein
VPLKDGSGKHILPKVILSFVVIVHFPLPSIEMNLSSSGIPTLSSVLTSVLAKELMKPHIGELL